jgi:hypothetical protein
MGVVVVLLLVVVDVATIFTTDVLWLKIVAIVAAALFGVLLVKELVK